MEWEAPPRSGDDESTEQVNLAEQIGTAKGQTGIWSKQSFQRHVRRTIARVVKDSEEFASLRFDDEYVKRYKPFEFALKETDFMLLFKRDGNYIVFALCPTYIQRGYSNLTRTPEQIAELRFLLAIVDELGRDDTFRMIPALRAL